MAQFEPAKERKTFFTVCSTMNSMRLWLSKKIGSKVDIKRAFGNQSNDINCFALCLEFLCQIKNGLDFESQLTWKSEIEEKALKMYS